MTGGLNRALPRPMLDLIRDGVRPPDLRRDGQRAVWSALFRTAASAVQRGWDCWEWQELVQQPASALGRQAATRDGHRPRTARATAKTLDAAWDRATAWASEQPPRWTRAEATVQALRRADLLTELAADPAADLPDAQRAVLAYASGQARRRELDRVPLPRRYVMAATGLGLTALRTALVRLDAAGLLVLAERGKPSPPTVLAKDRRANLYQLAREDHPALAAYLYRETRSVVPPAQVCGAPGVSADGAPPEICGASADDDRPTPGSEEHPPMNLQPMATLTVPLELVPELAAMVWAHEQRQREQREADAGNVVPLDRHQRQARQ